MKCGEAKGYFVCNHRSAAGPTRLIHRGFSLEEDGKYI